MGKLSPFNKLKKETKEYIKYHFFQLGENYMGWGEKSIRIRKRYEEHHKLGFNLALSFLLTVIATLIATQYIYKAVGQQILISFGSAY